MADFIDVVNAIKSLQTSVEAERTGTTAKNAEELDLENKMLAQRSKLLLEEIAAEEDLEKKAKLKIERNQLIQEQIKRSNKTNERKAELIKDLEKRQKKLTKTTEKATKAEQEHAAAVESVVGNLSGFLGVSRSYEKSLFSQIKAINKSKEAQKKLGEELSKTFTVGNVAYSGLAKASQLLLAAATKVFAGLEAGTTSFNKATGMADLYADTINNAADGVRHLGIENEDIAKSLSTLAAAFPLRELGNVRDEVARNFAVWERFGVSTETSAQTFTTLSRSLNMTASEAINTQEQIFALGRELGMGVGAMASSFQEALPRLGIYGNQAVNVFRKVASASSQLGISAADVLDLAEGFQTFEGSAEAAGKLNAILGGGFIDNLELMEASFEDPAKAALMIKDAFASAGKSVSSMGPAALKAAASSAGFSDVNKFRAFLDGKIDADKLLEDETKNIAIDTKKIAEKSQTIMQKILDKLTAIANSFLLGGMSKLINNLNTTITDATPGGIATAAGGATALGLGGTLGLQLAGKSLMTRAASPDSGPLLGRLGGLGKFGKGLGIAGTLASVGTQAFDMAQGGATGGNVGSLVGSLAGGAAGLLGGPLAPILSPLFSVGGSMLGEAIGKAFDPSMPAKPTNTSAGASASAAQAVPVHVTVELTGNETGMARYVDGRVVKVLSPNTAV